MDPARPIPERILRQYAGRPATFRWLDEYRLEIALPDRIVVRNFAPGGLDAWLRGVRMFWEEPAAAAGADVKEAA